MAVEETLIEILRKPVAKGSRARYNAVSSFFSELHGKDPLGAEALQKNLGDKKHPARIEMDRLLTRSKVPRLIKHLSGRPDRGVSDRFGAGSPILGSKKGKTSAMGDLIVYKRAGKAIRPGGKKSFRVNEHEHPGAKTNWQRFTRNPATGRTPYNHKAYRNSYSLNIPYDMARIKTKLDMLLRDRMKAGLAQREEMNSQADIDRMKLAREVTKLKRMLTGMPTADLDVIDDIKIQKSVHYQRGELHHVGKTDDFVKGVAQADVDKAFESFTEEGELGDKASGKKSKTQKSEVGVGSRNSTKNQRATTKANSGTSGTGPALRGVATGLFTSAVTEAAVEERAEEHGYVPYLQHDVDQSKAETIGRFLTDPSMGRDIAMTKRYKPDKWRQKKIATLNKKKTGDIVTYVWDVFIERPPIDQMVYGSEHIRVKIRYKKLSTGKWLSLAEGSDSWPKRSKLRIPNLNRIIDLRIDNETIQTELGNEEPVQPIFSNRDRA